jgi:hypothetical protein
MMIPPFDYSSKEMMKFLALYQALKTIDVMSEDESNSEEENGEEESNGESATIIMPLVNPVMKKKKKAGSKSSYGSFRKLGTRK